MALVLADRVQETTTTIGTGTVTLAGAVSSFQSFSAIGDGNTTYYAITSGAEWEAGIGTYTAAGTTLARTTVLASSAAGAAISLSGTSNVFVTYPAEKSVNLNAVGGLSFGGLAISSPAWSTNGIGLVQAAATATDTSTAASGTVAAAYMNYFAPQTYAASNTGVTVTSLYGTYFSTPVAGTNVTATAQYGVGADSIVAITTLATGGAGSLSVGSGGVTIAGGGFTYSGAATNFAVSAQTSGLITLGGTSGTGIITLGQSTVSQTTNIQAGVTASGSTKTINLGTSGATGSTTSINIGSSTGTSTTTINGAAAAASTLTVGSTFTVNGGTASIVTGGGSTTANISTGTTASGSTKTVNIGTAGQSGSTTTITIGSSVSGATQTTTVNGRVTLAPIGASAASWTTNGVGLIQSAATFTDTTSTGTVAEVRMNVFAAQTIAASNSITVTSLFGTYFTAPARGTNVAGTTTYAVGAETLFVSGAVQFNSSLSVSGTLALVGGTGTITASFASNSTLSGSTKTLNIGTGGVSGSTTTITVGATNGTTTTVNGSTVFTGTFQSQGYTVATLPTAGTAGRRAHVTDALAPTFLGTLTGGGTTKCPVFDNGTAWVAG